MVSFAPVMSIPPYESERVTRKQRIDPKLKASVWKVVPFDPDKPLSAYEGCAVEEFPTDNGPADYALCVGGRILGIVEAKKLTLGPQNVLTQARCSPSFKQVSQNQPLSHTRSAVGKDRAQFRRKLRAPFGNAERASKAASIPTRSERSD